MAKQYFAKIPTIGYDIDGSGEKRIVIDIMQRAAIRNVLKNQSLIFYTYEVKDGETPEIIAHKLYGATSYHWIILFANDILDKNYDWPMSDEDLKATIDKKYSTPAQPGLDYAYSTVHHYEDLFGNEIDEFTFKSLADTERNKVTVYDWEMKQNDAKRTVRLLDTKYKDQIDAELDKIMKRRTV
jgi:hypothetical protein